MTEKKSEERIFDHPTPEQIKGVLEKAKKISQNKKKGSPAASPKKKDIVLEKIESLLKRQDRLEKIITAVGAPSSEKKATDQEKQATKTNEEILAQVQAAQEKAQGKQEAGQQLTAEQYQKMSNSEKVPLLEAQLQAQQGNPNNWGKIVQGINAVSPVVIEAMRHNQKNSGSIGSFFENLKIYSGVENAMLGNVFRFFKLLSPNQQAQGAQSLIEKAAKLPGFPELPPIDTGHIGE
jgi:vacuolar-type H+-ATPase subunit I/STV1